MSKKEDDKSKRAEAEVLKTLQSVDGWADIDPDPNFYALLRMRISKSEESQEGWLVRLLLGYRLAPAALTLFLILNVLTAWLVTQSGNEARAEYREAGIAAMADDFSISASFSPSENGVEREGR